jgi:glutamate/tyrosine decarboxylase-like PLP-dependent enzyme
MASEDLLNDAARRAQRYLEGRESRGVAPSPHALRALEAFRHPLPEEPCDPASVLAMLDEMGSPATVLSNGGRYFGFVTGAALPAALACNWLAGAWDQNAALRVMSPVSAALEDVALDWLAGLFGLPPGCGAGVVTGATMASFTALAAARRAVLSRAGWDVDSDGLFGAPPVTVITGDEVHAAVRKALGLLGLGRSRITYLPADSQGRMRAEALPKIEGPTIVCAQAGNVNTGAFDPLDEICAAAQGSGAWVHVDGAFGLWAAAAPERAYLTRGIEQADSWAVDCHKWLNVPYDSGVAFVREAEQLREAMTVIAPYLHHGSEREPSHYTPDSSRRARGVEIWAALLSLGKLGVGELVERCCSHAARLAEGLRKAGCEVLNEVVLNQVLVSFGSAEVTRSVIQELQVDGTCWCGGTEWQGHTAMRISVSSWATTDDDVDRSLEAILRIASDSSSRMQ